MMIGWCPDVRSFSVAHPFRPAPSAEPVGGDCMPGSPRGDNGPRGCFSAEVLVVAGDGDCADPRRPPLENTENHEKTIVRGKKCTQKEM